MDDPSQLQQHSDDHPGSASHPESGSGSKSSTWTSSSSVGNSPQNVTEVKSDEIGLLMDLYALHSKTGRYKSSSGSNDDYTKQIYYKYWIEEGGSYGSKEEFDKKVDELHARFLKNMDKNVEGPSDGVDIEILRVSHWIWGEEIESDQDQHSKCLSDDDDVDGDDHVHTKDSMPKDSPSKGDEDGPSDIPQWVMDNGLHE
ncbi:hypothetical protein Tco_0278163 [Tanacetum coccineum]